MFRDNAPRKRGGGRGNEDRKVSGGNPGGGGGFRGGRGGPGRRGDRGGPAGRGAQGGRGGTDIQVFRPPNDVIPASNEDVSRFENTFDQATGNIQNLQNLTIESSTFPIRPGYGTRGTPVALWANYVEMIPSSKMTLYRYDVAVSPETAGKKLNQVIRLLLESPDLASVREDIVTDFKSTMISRQRFQEDEKEIDIQYRSEKEDEPREDATTYHVRLLYTKTLRVSDLMNYLTSTNIGDHYDDKLSMVQALNIFLNHHAKSTGNLVTIGASKSFSLSNTSEKYTLKGGLTAIRGFFSSVRLASYRILVNVNVTHGAFYDSDRLDALIHNFGSDPYKVNRFLQRLKISSTHLAQRRNKAGEVIIRPKTIQGLATDVEFWLEGPSNMSTQTSSSGKKKKQKKPPSSAGPAPDGRYISVFDFFKITHSITVSHPNIPVVNVGTKERPSYLPPEVCVVIPGQAYNRQLDPQQTEQMMNFASRRPWANAKSIVERGFDTVGLSSSGNPVLGHFGVTAPPELIIVQGRVLNEPKAMYRGNNTVQMQSGSWNMLRAKFNAPGRQLKQWSYVLISTEGFHDAFPDPQSLAAVMGKLHRSLQDTGVVANQPLNGKRISVRDTDDPELEKTIRLAVKSLDLLFIILPTKDHPLWPRIKQLGDIKYGLPTICSVGSKLAQERGQDQYFKNEALKFNLKLGGVNQTVENISNSIVGQDKTMIVGLDVTHPSPGSSTAAPSVAGMVASVDKYLGQWPATLRLQSRARKEEVDGLAEILKRHLDLWRTKGKHASLPENIIVFRDGVSEGQFDKVINDELPQLRQACKDKYSPADQAKGLPKSTIAVVTKRHHTRFFPSSPQTADRFSNPRPGTVVDRGLTDARAWDFFMQPHASILGTARSAHYTFLLDEVFRSHYSTIPRPFKNVADVVEDLILGMSYNFGRATKGVSVCTPAKYADIVCTRARAYLAHLYDTASQSAISGGSDGASANNQDIVIHQNLRDSMFYI